MPFLVWVCFVQAVLLLAVPRAESFEPLHVKPTSYPVPANAVFVATDGRNSNSGARSSPLRTIARAVALASAGETVVVRQGTYREALPDVSKRLTLQPYPGEEVWLKGSIVVDGWTADGGVWRKEGWNYVFCDDCYHPGNVDPAFPDAGLPDQVFLDGAPLRQVAAPSLVTVGTFHVDDAAHRLLIGSDPVGRQVEASVRGTALTLWTGAEGSVIRGLGFAHYSPVAEPGLGGTVKADADDLVFENNTFAWSAVKGLEVFGRNAVVRENTFVNNGMMGLGAWQADGLLVAQNRFAANNRERFRQTGVVSEAAGAKLTATRGLTVTDNVFEDNYASGLWLDINVSDAVIARNIFRGNQRHGVFYEISSNGIVASNIVSGNGVSGIALADATNLQIYNNTLIGNGIGLLIQDDERVNDDTAQIERGNTWIAGDIAFYNNVIVAGERSGMPAIWVRDFTGGRDADAMLTASDFNVFVRSGEAGSHPLVEWWRRGERTVFSDIDAYRTGTGRDRHSLEVDAAARDAYFGDAPAGALQLAPDSPARGSGRNLPRSVADAIGIPYTVSPDRGALLLPGRRKVTP